MIKLKATKKEMKEGNYRILSIGYCDAQYLLKYEKALAYSSGNYGWACDYYEVDDVLISTGYSTLSDKNTKIEYATIREYDQKASKANNAKQVRALLVEMVNKAKIN